VPAPVAPQQDHEQIPPSGEKAERLEPTRYGDWELNGIAVDF
jgi:hypothetical protein